MRTITLVLSAGVSGLLTASAAHAQNFGMPAGARQWIEAIGNNVDNGTCCDEAIGGVGVIPYPSPNYVRYGPYLNAGCIIYVNGDSRANRMRTSTWTFKTDGVFCTNSMVDTYTINGPAGTEGMPVTAQLRMHMTGTIFLTTINPISNQYVGFATAEIEAGVWNPSTDPGFYEPSRVLQFDSNFFKSVRIPFGGYSSQPVIAVDLLIDQPLTRTVGAPFDVAFGANGNGHACGDISGSPAPADSDYLVTTIDWELPAGYSITSVLGWTDPNGSACEPCDTNCDGSVNGFDIQPFVNQLSGTQAACSPCAGDTNADGSVNGFDIQGFLDCLTG